MKKKVPAGRREALILLGSAGVVLVGCGGIDDGSEYESSEGEARRRWRGGRGGDTSGTGGGITGTGGSGNEPQCVLRPRQTEGPFPNLDERFNLLNRSDIRESQAGAELRLSLRAFTAGACAPIADAIVEIWHCNAMGNYSEYNAFNTANQNWLRGNQKTDANGAAQFTTIYPGWYPGRAVHIHFRIVSGSREFVSQLYFDENLTDEVHSTAPYTAHSGSRTPNSSDSIYRNGGTQLMLNVVKEGSIYTARFDVGLQI